MFVEPAASLQIEYPMMFKLDNRRGDRNTHCGVLEFIADEGLVYMPYWVGPLTCNGVAISQIASVLAHLPVLLEAQATSRDLD